MKLKKLVLVCFLFVAALLSLAGCKNSVETPPDITTTVADGIVTEPFNYRREQAVTQLKLPDLPDFKRFLPDPHYLPLGGGKLLTAYIDNGIFENTCVEICDLQTGEFSKVAVLQGVMNLSRALEDGKALLCAADGEYYVLSIDTGLTEKLDVARPFGVFSRDMSTYYYVKDRVLYRENLKSGESEIIKNEYNMRVETIEGIHTDKDLLNVLVFPSAYEKHQCSAIIDPADGSVLLLSEMMPANCAGTSVYGIVSAGEASGAAICCGSLDKNGEVKTVAMPELQAQNSPSVVFVNGSEYAFVQYSDDKESAELWQLGDTVKECGLSDYGFAGTVEKAVYIPEAQLIVASVYDVDADTYSTVLIDPPAVEFADGCEAKTSERTLIFDEALLADYYDMENWVCPEELKRAQAHADRLQEEYGIEILIGDHCKKFIEDAYHQTEVCNDAECIEKALDDMERAFKLYPDNFFNQFVDAAGNSGITLMLANIADDATGYAAYREDKNYLVIDLSGYPNSRAAYSAVCHELWHATENFIKDKIPDAFDDEKWNAMNPDGFEYANTYDCDVWALADKWISCNEAPENTYFTDSYGCTYPCEDRARIMEQVMTGEDGIKEMTECPHLKAKLRFMAEAIRQIFDTEGRGAPRWEEPLK